MRPTFMQQVARADRNKQQWMQEIKPMKRRSPSIKQSSTIKHKKQTNKTAVDPQKDGSKQNEKPWKTNVDEDNWINGHQAATIR